MPYVIVSECEHGFWSNQLAWVHDKSSASVFQTPNDVPTLLRDCRDRHLLDVAQAPEFYLDDPLLSGDCVILNDAEQAGAASEWFRIARVKTADGCARRSDDVVVLLAPDGTEVEAYARDLSLFLGH
jgi:hypothetical protein